MIGQWVRMRPGLSWHAVVLSRSLDFRTRCGRRVPRPASMTIDLPMGEPSCETCLRYLKLDEERSE
jgi:hypothetical protein